ncbi:MAG TPA: hypothetical protein VH054_01870 [Polyangiaceae bacterium]|jgi:hypothetical protein|nr:hypothetical protein [Polyangiaceae bacterium]
MRRVIFLGALLLGCSASSSDPTAADVQHDLDVNFGGYDDTREAPNFGDDAIASLPEFDDAYASSAQLSGSSMPTVAYRVALLWGHFPGANDESDQDVDVEPATWTGSIAVDAGGVDVVRTLSFGEGDSVDARTDPTSVSFTSHTMPFVDGMIVRVSTPIGSAARLHFSTTVLSVDVDLDAVASSSGMVFHGATDQGLAVVGWNDTAATCPSGVAYGRFVKLGAAVGTIRGRLADGSGADLGVVHGIWGHAKNRDADVFFTKSIDPAGNFGNLGLGQYAIGAMTGAQGDVASQHGKFGGVYSDGYDRPDGRGVFVAKWSSVCSPM